MTASSSGSPWLLMPVAFRNTAPAEALLPGAPDTEVDCTRCSLR